MKRMPEPPEFVIYTPPFDERNGGVLALFELCERLNVLGYSAAIWPWEKPPLQLRTLTRLSKYLVKRKWRRYRGPFKPRIARYRDLRTAIVVYPEIIAGDPLDSGRVVRWLLHKPGYHTGQVSYGKNELFFYYNEAFNDPSLNPHRDRLLQVSYMHPAYQKTNDGPRSGSCVVIRKGRGRVLDQHPANSLVIDELGHEDTASVLNRCEFMYSYDPYSFYATYAIICGCVPIVLPEEGVSKAEWCPSGNEALGQAYGVEEAETARSQRPIFMQRLSQQRLTEDNAVRRFVAICREHFSDRA